MIPVEVHTWFDSTNDPGYRALRIDNNHIEKYRQLGEFTGAKKVIIDLGVYEPDGESIFLIKDTTCQQISAGAQSSCGILDVKTVDVPISLPENAKSFSY
jgi:hypothetical protein